MDSAGRLPGELRESADIKVNGERPWDLRSFITERFFGGFLPGGSLALGESCMDG